jgi:hypothetical protein
MLSFEEFFKKKRIDLDTLQQSEPALFSEFKMHYLQMGEKSFDHTKKYWFNKIRRQFPLAVEVKTEKVKIDNPLAEQTITESLIEQSAPSPKLGFVPKFRASAPPKPVESTDAAKAEEQPATPAPKPGFTPRFKAANMPKPAVEQPEEAKTEEQPATPVPKLGFTPKFKAANMVKPAAPVEDTPDDIPESNAPVPEIEAAKPAYKPRFNIKNIPKKEEE